MSMAAIVMTLALAGEGADKAQESAQPARGVYV